MPNALAYLVVFASPLMVVVLFRMLPRTQALIWSVVGGYMFLPMGVGIDLPLLPPFSKELLPVLAAGIMCLIVRPDRPSDGAPAPAARSSAGSPFAAPPSDPAHPSIASESSDPAEAPVAILSAAAEGASPRARSASAGSQGDAPVPGRSPGPSPGLPSPGLPSPGLPSPDPSAPARSVLPAAGSTAFTRQQTPVAPRPRSDAGGGSEAGAHGTSRPARGHPSRTGLPRREIPRHDLAGQDETGSGDTEPGRAEPDRREHGQREHGQRGPRAPDGGTSTADAAEAAASGVRRRSLVGNALLLMLLGIPFVTALGNADAVRAGPRVIAGLKAYDAFSMLLGVLVTVLPLLLARRWLATPAHHVVLLRILLVAGLIYSLPALVEIRLSPQLNRWIYGYAPNNFIQQVRDGGYRPILFIGHGLRVALFFSMSIVAAFALWRTRGAAPGGASAGARARALLGGGWLFGVLVLCKTLGALASTILLAPFVLLTSVRTQMGLAAVLAGVVLFYPMLRGADLIPVERIENVAASISAERAGSLQFRLKNEDILLARAREKPVAGWGTWGRNRVYDDQSGQDVSVTDGAWIIIIGSYGWIGYIGQFGLLTIPTILLAWNRRRFAIAPATAGVCLVLTANLIDLIPNSGLTMMTWLVGGAVLGLWERGGEAAPAAAATIQGRASDRGMQAAGALRRSRSTRGTGPATATARGPRSIAGPSHPAG